PFFEAARSFTVNFDPEDILGYELGDADGEVVIMVHGWDSNPGSMSKIAFALVDQGYRVIAMNLPGHAMTEMGETNLFVAKNGLKAFLAHLNLSKPISCVTHSFGSAMLSFSLADLDLEINKMVFLTCANRMQDLFVDFKDFIGLGDRAFGRMCKMADNILGEPLAEMEVAKSLKKVNFGELLLVHDKNDKIIPFTKSQEIHDKHPRSILKIYENIGHYRMLWNDNVLNDTLAFISKNN
ncbi:MAG: pimeloyl-ACP methyl ester carboxylesterase, partial [Glaciecola sp.]